MFKNSIKATVATMLATAKTFKAKSESPYFITLSEGNKKMGLPIYTAVESFTNEPKKERCECVDCGHCRKCWSAIEMLKCEIH